MHVDLSGIVKPVLVGVLLWVVQLCSSSCAPADNKQAASAHLSPPKFSVPSGIYTNNIDVRLTTTAPGSVIRYTLDGSEPTANSTKFSQPIEISGSTLLRAKVFDAKGEFSPIVTQTYVLAEPDLASFSSNLPLVILNSFGQGIPHGQAVPVSARFIGTNAGRSTLFGPADFDGRGEINVRGHTSLRYPKHSYHIKTQDEAHSPEKAAIFGLPKDANWVLYAPYPDKTLLRDVLAYELSNKMGRYAPRTRFVEVFVNESGSRLTPRDYQGVYVFEEKVKRGKDRVPVQKLTSEDNSDPAVTGGYMFKKDHLDSVDMGRGNFNGMPNGGPPPWANVREGFPTPPGGFPADPAGFLPAEGEGGGNQSLFFQQVARFSSSSRLGFRSSQGSHFLYVEPKPEEISPAQRTWLTRYVNRFETALYGNNFRDPKTGYAAYIDPDSFIDHHWLVEATKNIDGFRFSTFYYKDRGGKINMGPIWDWNLSMGNANGKQGWIPEYWYWPQLDDQQYSWFRRLFEDPDFAQKYVDRWGELRTNEFSVAKLHARIDELAALLNEAQARNYKRWRIMGRSVWPNTFVGRSYQDEVNWLKQWMQTRLEWIDKQFIAAPSVSLKPGSVEPGSKVTLRAAGKIYYTLDGSDPRASGGGVSQGAQAYRSGIVINDNVTLFSRTLQDNRWSYPAVCRYSVGKVSGSK